MPKRQRIAIMRLSALGDVALTVPVLYCLLRDYPELHVTLITRGAFAPLVAGLDRVTLFAPDLQGRHKGLLGLRRMAADLEAQHGPHDTFVDWHDVTRSQVVRTVLRLRGVRIAVLDKGRRAKKENTRRGHLPPQPLPHTTERYAQALAEAGWPVQLRDYRPVSRPATERIAAFAERHIQGQKCIGIAPFAQHQPKAYPLQRMAQVIESLTQAGVNVLLFGGGAQERQAAEALAAPHKKVHSVIGSFTLSEELALMQQLPLLLSMDSSNMHLARLVGTKTASIWGATHSYNGFGAWDDDGALRFEVPVATLPCRPCSVYGNKPCHRGDHACMTQLSPIAIAERLLAALA